MADQTEKENILASEDWRKVPLDSEKHGIVEKARLSEVLFKSLQSSTIEQNKLIGLINTTKGQLKLRKLQGLVAVLKSLSVPSQYETEFTTNGRWKGYLPFELAFDIYADFVYTSNREYVTLEQQKNQFREDLLHPEHGLCVYIFKCQERVLVILQSDEVELSGLLNVSLYTSFILYSAFVGRPQGVQAFSQLLWRWLTIQYLHSVKDINNGTNNIVSFLYVHFGFSAAIKR